MGVNIPALRAVVGDGGRGVSHKSELVVGFRRVTLDGGENCPMNGDFWEAKVIVKDAAGQKQPDRWANAALIGRTIEEASVAFRSWYIDTGEFIVKSARMKRKGGSVYLFLDCDRFLTAVLSPFDDGLDVV